MKFKKRKAFDEKNAIPSTELLLQTMRELNSERKVWLPLNSAVNKRYSQSAMEA